MAEDLTKTIISNPFELAAAQAQANQQGIITDMYVGLLALHQPRAELLVSLEKAGQILTDEEQTYLNQYGNMVAKMLTDQLEELRNLEAIVNYLKNQLK